MAIVIKGKDSSGNNSFISVEKSKDGKVRVFSPEDAGDVVFTVKQAKELAKAIESTAKQ